MANPFAGLGDAKVTAGGIYFDVPRDASGKETGNGLYRVTITGCKVIQSMRSRETMFIVETNIVSSNVRARPAGMACSQVINLGNIMGLPNVKAFVAAASGVNPAAETVNQEVEKAWQEITGRKVTFEQIAEILVSPEQPLAGLDLKLETAIIKTVGKGQPFTKHFWYPLPDDAWQAPAAA